MKIVKLLFPFIALAASSTVVAQNEVLVTGASSKAGNAVSLDIVSDGSVVAFNFALDFGADSKPAVDVSKCGASLPKGWEVRCAMKDGQFRIAALGGLDNPLPKGVAQIGTISAKGVLGKISISELEMADRSANVLPSKSTISAE